MIIVVDWNQLALYEFNTFAINEVYKNEKLVWYKVSGKNYQF